VILDSAYPTGSQHTTYCDTMDENGYDDAEGYPREILDDDESNEDRGWQHREGKIVIYNWTKEATRLLIGLRTSLDAEFEDSSQRKMDLWDRISAVLRDHGFDFPAGICDKKWRNLLVSFRRTNSRGTPGQLNRFPYRWEFYTDLLEYWKKKDPAFLEVGSNGSGSGNENEGDDMGDIDEDEDDGDLNKYLSVTLEGSDGEPDDPNPDIDEKSTVNTNNGQSNFQSTIPLPPSLTMAPSMQLRSRDTLRDTPPSIQQQGFLAQLNMSPVTVTSVNINGPSPSSGRGRNGRVVSNSIVIEEVKPSIPSTANMKSEPDADFVPFKLSSLPRGIDISIRERTPEEKPLPSVGFNAHAKRPKRDWEPQQQQRESDSSEEIGKPKWFQHYVQHQEERDQRRWEERKAIWAQKEKSKRKQFELMHDLKVKEIQALNRLTALLVTVVQSQQSSHTHSPSS